MDEDKEELRAEPRDDVALPDAAVNPALALWLLGDQLDELEDDGSSDD